MVMCMTDASSPRCYYRPMTRDPKVTPLERAFELARSGRFSNVADIKKHLQREGFETAQVTGSTLTKQLNQLMRTSGAKAD